MGQNIEEKLARIYSAQRRILAALDDLAADVRRSASEGLDDINARLSRIEDSLWIVDESVDPSSDVSMDLNNGDEYEQH